MARTLDWGIGIAVAASLAVFAGGIGDAGAQGLFCSGQGGIILLPAFVGLPAASSVTSSPISCTVNCSTGGTIASALAMQPRTTSTLTVTITGTCVESVDHVPSRVVLQAGASGATLQAPGASTDPVLGISGTGVTLNNLTISGGVNALRGRSGAAFTGNNLLIEGASNADVLLNHAVVTLNTSTIQNSSNDGIDSHYGSTVFLKGGIVQQNAGIGVFAGDDGSAEISGGAVLQKNGNSGAGSGRGGTVTISDATVANNAIIAGGGVGGIGVSTGGHAHVEGSSTKVINNNTDGIDVYDGGDALIENGVTISGNSGQGVKLDQGAFAKVRLGAIIERNSGDGVYVGSGTVTVGDSIGPATVQNNGGNGIHLRTNSVATFYNSGTQIVNNTGWGILCTGTPSNPLMLIYGAVGTVSGNGAGQVSCNVAP